MVSLPVLGVQSWGVGSGEERVAAACFQHLVFLTSKSGLKGCVYGQTAGEWGLGHSWSPGGRGGGGEAHLDLPSPPFCLWAISDC